LSRRGVLAVVGAINVDLVVTSARLPRAGETVVGSGPRSFGGGKGANAAVAAARAGAEVVLVGTVGDDQTGSETLERLAVEKVDVASVSRLRGEPTGVALIVVDEAGENQIAVGAGANAALDETTVRDALESRLAELGCVLVSTEIPDGPVLAAVRTAAAAGVPCVLNPAPPTAAVDRSVAEGAILTPNVGELESLLLRLGEAVGREPEVDARTLARRSGAPVIVTRGGDGVLVATTEGLTALPAPPALVLDTTGAGDTFNGVLAARLAAGEELVQAARVAVTAASLSVGSRGAREGMPTAAQIEAAGRQQFPRAL
jgi:ribokinase